MGGRESRKQWLKICSYGDMPLVKVREVAQVYKAKRSLGTDPAEQKRKAAEKALTVADVAKRFLAEYIKGLKPRTVMGHKTAFKLHILPELGKIPIKDLTRETVARWLASKKHVQGEGMMAANRAFATLSAMCNQAEIWNLIPQGSNPCKHVKKFPTKSRVRDIQYKELEAVGRAIEKLGPELNLWALAAIKITALCAGRSSEVLSLRRDREIYLDEGYAVLKEHKTSGKTGAKRLELPEAAVEILRALPSLKGNPWYFPSERKKGAALCYLAVNAAWNKICAEAGVADLHLHDFRSFAASEGLEQGIDARTTARLLGHSSSRTTERHYLRVRQGQTAEAAAQIAAPIAKAFKLKK
jgi:integrase